jgi:beta-galactosidase
MIRPMQRERVLFPAVRDPLLAGVTTGDIVMSTGERIFHYIADEYLVSDEFSYIVDYEDVAPFAKSRLSPMATSPTALSVQMAGR